MGSRQSLRRGHGRTQSIDLSAIDRRQNRHSFPSARNSYSQRDGSLPTSPGKIALSAQALLNITHGRAEICWTFDFGMFETTISSTSQTQELTGELWPLKMIF